MKSYVIAGGPGIGKSTVIELLASKGYNIIPEAARIIIESELATNGDALPWTNVEKFIDKFIELQIKNEEEAAKKFPENEIVFLDRGVIDPDGYNLADGRSLHPKLKEIAPNRYGKVFILDRLPTYENDTVRKENHEQAEKYHQGIIQMYKNFGYEPVFVPVIPPEERVQFILNNVEK